MRVKQWKTVRANACKNRTINLKSKNVDRFKFHRLLNLSSGNSMISTSIVFCLMLVTWEFVHSDEVPSRRDKIRQRFSFLDQLDSLLKSYKYDDNDSHLPTLPANANSMKSNNLLATTTVGGDRAKMPHHSRTHPNNWRLDNRYYEDGSKTYNNYGNTYNGGNSYHMYDNYGRLREILAFRNHLPWRKLLLRNNGLHGYRENHMSDTAYKRPLVEDINNLLYVTEMGCEFLATFSRNDPTFSVYTPELRSWLRFMKTSGNLVISSPTRNIERLSCDQAWIRTWEFGLIRFKYRKNGYRYMEGSSEDPPFKFVFKQPSAHVMKNKLEDNNSRDTISRSAEKENDVPSVVLNTMTPSTDSMHLPTPDLGFFSKRSLSIEKKARNSEKMLTTTAATNRRKRLWGFYHRRRLSDALQSLRKSEINDREIRMRVDLG